MDAMFRLSRYRQGDDEVKLGLPRTPNMQRDTSVSSNQISFIDYVIAPLFSLFQEVLPHGRTPVFMTRS